MFPTLEVRWISKGTLPAGILEWFRSSGKDIEPAHSRIDHYFIGHMRETVGIKLREGRIELKVRQKEFGTIRFSDRVAGRLEYWCKWGFGLAEGHGDRGDITSAGLPWVGVEKERSVLKHIITSNGLVSNQPPEVYPTCGCDVEITALVLDGEKWWSVALEAYGGDTETMHRNLVLVAEHVFPALESIELDEAISSSYPEWLVRCGKERFPGS